MSWWQRVVRIFSVVQSQPPRISATGATPLLRPRIFSEPFQENDIVVLRDHGRLFKLSRPLTPGGIINLSKGHVSHDTLLGKFPGEAVISSSGNRCFVEEASLADYVKHSRRIVTPIYPDDAEKIVSKLDINVASVPEGYNGDQRLEILEAGTGHGALTLHLSRAISALNPPLPRDEAQYEAWASQRRAVVHTIEISAKHSKHARKVIKEFRRGIYQHNIDFHVGSVSDWVKDRGAKEPFLAHAFLDLPSPTAHLATVASALRPHGKLMVFAPSITTILECFQTIKLDKLDLFHSSTIEFGNNGATGGREWDLRQVVPRKFQPKNKDVVPAADGETAVEDGDSRATEAPQADEQDADEANAASDEQDPAAALKWVCRPKVGDRINGGGFLGIFVKKVI